MLCASEYRSKQSGTGETSTPLAPGARSFSQTPIYARVTAHEPPTGATGPTQAPSAGAVHLRDGGEVALAAPPLHTAEPQRASLPARTPPFAAQQARGRDRSS